MPGSSSLEVAGDRRVSAEWKANRRARTRMDSITTIQGVRDELARLVVAGHRIELDTAVAALERANTIWFQNGRRLA